MRPPAPKGRSTADDPPNRFESLRFVPDEPAEGRDTEVLIDSSRSILSRNDSPDVGFDTSLNPYRGCEHGCSYCYARPTHEYLGFSAGLDFETRILAKPDAAELLRAELDRRSWRPRPIAMSGVTDPYQPVERRWRITRACLEVLAEYRNPVAIITKSALVCRDGDLLSVLARHGAASVGISLTTLDVDLARAMEPRASRPADRLRAIRHLKACSVPTGVIVAPVIPGLNDAEIPALLAAAADAGADFAAFVMLRLPGPVGPLFESWLDRFVPEKKDRVLSRVRGMRGGRLNDPRFHSRGRGEGPYAEQIHGLFEGARKRLGLPRRGPGLSVSAFRRPGDRQIGLFDRRRDSG